MPAVKGRPRVQSYEHVPEASIRSCPEGDLRDFLERHWRKARRLAPTARAERVRDLAILIHVRERARRALRRGPFAGENVER